MTRRDFLAALAVPYVVPATPADLRRYLVPRRFHAMDFAGARVNVGSILQNPTRPLFVAAWVYMDATASQMAVCGNQGANGWSFRCQQWNNSGKIGFTHGGVGDYTSALTMATTAWRFIGVIRRTTALYFFDWNPAARTLSTDTVSNSDGFTSTTNTLAWGTGEGSGGFADFNGKLAWGMAAESFDPSDDTIKAIAEDPLFFLTAAKIEAASTAYLWPLWGLSGNQIDLGTAGADGTVTSATRYEPNPPTVTFTRRRRSDTLVPPTSRPTDLLVIDVGEQ